MSTVTKKIVNRNKKRILQTIDSKSNQLRNKTHPSVGLILLTCRRWWYNGFSVVPEDSKLWQGHVRLYYHRFISGVPREANMVHAVADCGKWKVLTDNSEVNRQTISYNSHYCHDHQNYDRKNKHYKAYEHDIQKKAWDKRGIVIFSTHNFQSRWCRVDDPSENIEGSSDTRQWLSVCWRHDIGRGEGSTVVDDSSVEVVEGYSKWKERT